MNELMTNIVRINWIPQMALVQQRFRLVRLNHHQYRNDQRICTQNKHKPKKLTLWNPIKPAQVEPRD